MEMEATQRLQYPWRSEIPTNCGMHRVSFPLAERSSGTGKREIARLLRLISLQY